MQLTDKYIHGFSSFLPATHEWSRQAAMLLSRHRVRIFCFLHAGRGHTSRNTNQQHWRNEKRLDSYSLFPTGQLPPLSKRKKTWLGQVLTQQILTWRHIQGSYNRNKCESFHEQRAKSPFSPTVKSNRLCFGGFGPGGVNQISHQFHSLWQVMPTGW